MNHETLTPPVADQGQGQNHIIEIKVNSRAVNMPGSDREPTGREILAAAIAQGVAVESNFVLQLELPNGSSKIIGPDDPVKIHPGSSFTAIRPDDNS